MSRTVASIIDEARDRHPRFDPVRQPNGPVYRALARICQDLQIKLTAIDPSMSSVEVTRTYQLPLADFDAGLALGTTRRVTDIILVDPPTVATPRSYTIALVPRDQRAWQIDRYRRVAWQEGDRLFLGGPSQRWADQTGTIEVRVAMPLGDVEIAALQVPGATLPLPDECATAVVEALATFMGRRSDPPIDFSDAAAAAEGTAILAATQRLNGLSVDTEPWYP